MDTNYVWFDSGNNVKKELLDSNLQQTDESEYTRFINNKPSSIINTPTDINSWESLLGNESKPVIQPIPVKEKSAIQIVLEKQKKFEKVKLLVEFDLEIPSAKALEFMTVMFDEEEVIQEVSSMIMEKMTKDAIVEIVNTNIKQKIHNIIQGLG